MIFNNLHTTYNRDCTQAGITLPTLKEGQQPNAEQLKEIVSKFLHFHNPLVVADTEALQDTQILSPVTVERGNVEVKECICKKYDLIWGARLTCEERKKVVQVCANIWGEGKKIEKANKLMAIMHVESDFDPQADNGVGYIGLIQFSVASAQAVGTTQEALKKMTFIEQMDYVEKYLIRRKSELNTMTDLYLMVLKPNAVGQGNNPEYAIFDESVSVPNVPYNSNNLGKEPWVTKYGYASNPTYMREEGEYGNKRQFQTYSKGIQTKRGFANGKTYVWEVTEVLKKEHYDKGIVNKFHGNCINKSDLVYNEILENPLFNYVKIAGSFIDIKEGNNPIIENFFKEIGYKGFKDSTAWCAAFLNYCLKKGNPEIPRKNALNAVSFSYSGYEEVETPYYGSFMVRADNGTFYKQGSQGHVAIVVGKVGDSFAQLGGNQAVPGERIGTTVNVVLRKRQSNVKYFHPNEVPKIELGKSLFEPAEKQAGVDIGSMTR